MNKKSFDRKYLCIPYGIFLVFFVLVPFAVIVKYAFTDINGGFSIENLKNFLISPNTIGTLVYSLAIASITTIVCLILGYPIAYFIARSDIRIKSVLVFVFVMPMWINFTLRITALKEILTVIEGNLSNYPFINTVIGMSYDFLPFMILPMYTTLLKLDNSLIEAAQDLGANSIKTFIRIILPLSVPGIVSGAAMVFLPAMTNYVVLDMLYNRTYIMGSLIGAYFSVYDWNNGSMVSLILLILILLFTLFANSFSVEESAGEGRRADEKNI